MSDVKICSRYLLALLTINYIGILAFVGFNVLLPAFLKYKFLIRNCRLLTVKRKNTTAATFIFQDLKSQGHHVALNFEDCDVSHVKLLASTIKH